MHFAEAAALGASGLAAAQQQVRACVPRWFARGGLIGQADPREIAPSRRRKISGREPEEPIAIVMPTLRSDSAIVISQKGGAS
ncbi:MAG: hypothetical protein HY067_02680 [Betaproteobacteria bacterium]|nr:hypothetical protein [Betaproteobacteria bacterium]